MQTVAETFTDTVRKQDDVFIDDVSVITALQLHRLNSAMLIIFFCL